MTPAILIVASTLLTSCRSSSHPRLTDSSPTPRPSSSGEVFSGIVDPLSEINDPDNERYVDQDFSRILDVRGIGAHTWRRSVPATTKSVRVYVACAPDATFSVHAPKWFSGACSTRFQNYADIPVSGTTLTIKLSLPGMTRYSFLVITTPED